MRYEDGQSFAKTVGPAVRRQHRSGDFASRSDLRTAGGFLLRAGR